MIKPFKIELFSNQECSLYFQDLFGYDCKDILLFVVILSKIHGPVNVILWEILNWSALLFSKFWGVLLKYS